MDYIDVVKVNSSRKLTDTEKSKIADIMKHSQCPNESLISSLDDCHGIDGEGTLTIGQQNNYEYIITY